ncbi:hypothetical protein [Shewanella surugensis]|nr:hypothetical protein [Shewanella surugensis]
MALLLLFTFRVFSKQKVINALETSKHRGPGESAIWASHVQGLG